MPKNTIRTWTVGAYVIEPVPGDPSSSFLYSYGQIDPFGWLPDWFVTKFSPSALETVIFKVSNFCKAEQKKQNPKFMASSVGANNANKLNYNGLALASVSIVEGSGGSRASSKQQDKKKDKKIYKRILNFFKNNRQVRKRWRKQGRGQHSSKNSKDATPQVKTT